MPLPAILGVGAAIAAAAGGVMGIVDNYSQSRENQDNANRARETGEQQWTGDRQIISSEWTRISAGFTGEYAPALAPCEAFQTWSHKKIWEALNGQGEFADKGPVKESDINAGADAWRRLQESTSTAIDEFRGEIETAITEKWGGHTATTAMQSTIAYTDKAKLLPLSFQMVANGIDLMQGYLGQAQLSVVPPVETSGFDEFVGHIPGNGVLKANAHRANEAEAAAQDIMMRIYQPGVTEVDGHTPVLPTPHNPVNGTTDNGPGTETPTGTTLGGPTIRTPTAPGEQNPNQDQNQRTQPSSTTDTGTQPSSPNTTSASTETPHTRNYLEDPLGRTTNTPGTTTSPGTPGSHVPGSTPQTPSPGRSVPGQPGRTNQGTPATRTGTPGTTAARGTSGMPGMASPGARGRNEDDDEHKTPDYLVYERAGELIGDLPPVLPPGGVIGG
ncbi:hypothetical protein [Nocardia brevicatena]|uniref:hypothetical protein n=1 Tax=Nocardia brevicatena TaxID=37327 RepID=UPI0002F802DC|nr:hypothetical protein [Nocardia brevicatena]